MQQWQGGGKVKREVVQRLPLEVLDMSVVRPCRENLRPDVVERYAALFTEDRTGWPFNSKVMVARLNGKYIVMDGQHRIEAAKAAGKKTIIAETFIPLDMNDVIRTARAANSKHGERLSASETRANISAYLSAGGATDADSAIALLFGVSRDTVASIRATNGMPSRKQATEAAVLAAIQSNPEASAREISKQTGIPRATVRRVGQNAEFPQNGPPSMPQRKHNNAVTDNGLIQNTPKTDSVPPPMPPRVTVSDSVPTSENTENSKLSMPRKIDSEQECIQKLEPIRDEVGQDVPPDMWVAWEEERERVAGWLKQIRAVRRDVRKAVEAGALRSLRYGLFTQTLEAALDKTVASLLDIRPEAICSCGGFGCKRCHERGWMTKDQYRRNIPELEQINP